ncbi:hypothetical protein AB0D99_01880 [Streptomyces sp. NPDC047971]|uniref:hypothetical protein n=1 Tax=Streptomyces sp. NPDC047971 TaxID=3154499 RepID=UPI0033F53FE0
MNHATPLRRTLTALTATTLLAGGLLLGQTVTAEPAHAAGKKIVCDVPKLRQQAAELRSKAAKLQRLGSTAEARKVRAYADALERQAQACVDADNNAGKPWQ